MSVRDIPVSPGESFDSESFLKTAPQEPGVYLMLDAEGGVLYVGKARCLKKRLASYFQKARGQTIKIQTMLAKVRAVDTTVTRTEGEALLLEQNMIKASRPPYNVLLRDDKSYPSIRLSGGEWPSLSLHRGRAGRNKSDRFFGPYPDAGAVRETLALLQKTFHVRQCSESFFRNRTRPCLQYQIKRCKAPCVGLVDAEEYRRDVEDSVNFLKGCCQGLIHDLIARMETAAAHQAFETAAALRDTVVRLRKIQQQQIVAVESGDVDVFAQIQTAEACCIVALFVRQGRVLGTRSFFPAFHEQEPVEALENFLGQFYVRMAGRRDFPREIILPCAVPGYRGLEEAIGQLAGKKVVLRHSVRSTRQAWLELAERNARQALAERRADRSTLLQRFMSLKESLHLTAMPERIECFDVSHTHGEETMASCVVCDREGIQTGDYRRYCIKGIEPGDDYAAMAQAVRRRFTPSSAGQRPVPDLLLVDGGIGQLRRVREVLESLGLGTLVFFGVAKGAARKPGAEVLINGHTGQELRLESSSPALHLVQQVRDESHRFAISGHRRRRDRKRTHSNLEDIAGVGPGRRAALLSFFGSLQAVREAELDELVKVRGISRALAQTIVDELH